MMNHCLHCGEEIEKDDNFCPKCGHWTSRGYSFLQNKENENIINGMIINKQNKVAYLFFLLFISIIITIGMTIYRGQDILKPFVYLKRQIINYKYGYKTTILKTDNQYFNLEINDLESANKQIIKDFSEQSWQCKNNYEISKIEKKIEDNFKIPSVKFCDITINESKKISNVITNIYKLFPNIQGYLTNISISNSDNKDNYVAYFQPIYEFVNSTNNIDNYNRVNKTQILLNSYYFANEDILNKPLKENWYVSDATWESLVAHEFGHYIVYVVLLKSKNINNITLTTKDNIDKINEIKEEINNEICSKSIVENAILNYNNKYKMNISIEEFAGKISNYAKAKNSKGNYIYDEIIAEAIHDYYLHKNNSTKESLEIIKIINMKIR